jgi:16S rRNA (cytosine1407-C5)-methyltransferase
MSKSNSHPIVTSLERFSEILSEDEIRQIIAIQDAPLPTGIRVNPLKGSPRKTMLNLADRYNWQVKPIDFCHNAWMIESAEFPPGKTIEHRMGMYYLQDAASMVPVSLFEFAEPRPLILDMAASPGGKTTHLIDRSADQGLIVANDASHARVPALRSVLAAWGGLNQVVTHFSGEFFGSWFPETFDMVLLDAPCSMENLRPTPNHPLRETSPTERLRLQDRQVGLLISGLSALKTGGQMVYATCSLAPEEDEAVIDRALKMHPGTFIVEDSSERVSFNTPGLTAFAGQSFHPALKHSLRLWPHLTGMSGFFCARLKKLHPIVTPSDSPPSRDFSRTGLEPVSEGVHQRISAQIYSNYGFDLSEILQSYRIRLFARHENIFLIPESYLANFSNLPYEYIGMPLGQWAQDELQPAHDFISRFGHLFTRGKIRIEGEQVDMWISGRDIRYPNTNLAPKGQYLLVVDDSGRNLGMGKLLSKRLRNMLPTGRF